MNEVLKQHLAAHPAMTAQDAVKLVFQARLGVGHLLRDPSAAMQYLLHELDTMPPQDGEPLYEAIGPDYIRLHLRPAKAMGWQPSWLLQMMLHTAGTQPAFSRTHAVNEARAAALHCGLFSEAEVQQAVQPLLDSDTWLPSHSEAYRAAYAPAYRVVSSAFIPLLPILTALAAQQDQPRLLLTIDGPCGSGKTTLTKLLTAVLAAPAVHTDDFVIPHAQKTAERLALPGGNEDVDRLCAEVLHPWLRDGHATYRAYDCMHDCLKAPVHIPDSRILILEGSYSNMPPIRELAHVRVWLSISRETQLARLLQRDGEARLPGYQHRWIPLEQAYHQAYGLPDEGCLVLAAPGTDV